MTTDLMTVFRVILPEMSSTSQKIPAVTIVKPRLITVGRGKAPLVQTERRPGPSHHVGAFSVPEARSAQHHGAGSTSAQAPTVVRGVNLLGRSNEDSQLGLRRPKHVRQEPNVLNYQSNNIQTEEVHHQSTLSYGLKDRMTERSKMADIDRNDQKEKMKEELAKVKEDFLMKKVEKLQKEKDFEIKRLNTELEISHKLFDIQANMTAKKGNVLADVSPEVSSPPPPAVNNFQFPYRPLYLPPDLAAPPPFRRFSVPQPVAPPDYRQSSQPAPRGDLATSRLAPPVPSLFDHPLSSGASTGRPSQGEEVEPVSAVSYYSDDDQGVNRLLSDMALVCQQEEILKQIEENNRKKKLAETQSLKLIQQMSMEENLNPASTSSSSNMTNHQASYFKSFNHTRSDPQVKEDSWTKVAKNVRGPPASQKQERARKEQKEMKEMKERQWEEWRQEMREKEEKARKNILQSHLDSQKLRMVKEGSSSGVLRGPSKSPEMTSAISGAPVQGLTLGDLVPAERRPKAALRQKRSQRQTELSEFEAERRRAERQVKQRIEAQVSFFFNKINIIHYVRTLKKRVLFSRPFFKL